MQLQLPSDRPLLVTQQKAFEVQALARAIRADPGAFAKFPKPDVARVNLAVQKSQAAGRNSSSIVCLALTGFLEFRQSLFGALFGGTDLENFGYQLEQAAANQGIKCILILIDSPGGEITGIPETADKILEARKSKTVIAAVSPMACSAAYWLACCCDQIVLMPSGEVGAIGAYVFHWEQSRALDEEGITVTLVAKPRLKVGGNVYEPLDPARREDMEQEVSETYSRFVAAVAKGRRVSASTVREDFGGGLIVRAQQALKVGMVDRIGTFDQVYRQLAADAPSGRMQASTSNAEVLRLRRQHELDKLGSRGMPRPK